ncbi:Cyclin [Parasponia andersonii]|uniref:B-like cyclin n=1 Tax=Parasponia andersonii TaxID=3476 RepID=A0A2P5D268_PARAD|nr:Cyclin [Parasponia andersonii]
MRTTRSPTATTTTRAKKDQLHLQNMPPVKKKLRSELPRRRRPHISPVALRPQDSRFASFSVDSSSCSYFGGGEEVSCESSRVSAGSKKSKAKSILRKREFGELGLSSYGGGLALGKSYFSTGRAEEEASMEVSESSCVESNCGNNGGFGDSRRLNLKSSKSEKLEIGEDEEEDSKAVTKAEISCVEQISGYEDLNTAILSDHDHIKENEAVSCISASESKRAHEKKPNQEIVDRAEELDFCVNAKNSIEVSNSESTIDQKPETISLGHGGIDSELACTEQFSYDSDSDFSSTDPEAAYSKNFLENSELDFSDYTPSIFEDSGSEFSERSEGDSASSLTFSLLFQYRDRFVRSTSAHQDIELLSSFNEEYMDESRYERFEDEADEESYEILRERERRRVVLRDYLEEYSSTTEYANLIIHQRWTMIHWIIENLCSPVVLVWGSSGYALVQWLEVKYFACSGSNCNTNNFPMERCNEKDLQQETMFLGISLLDRFLSKGFFKNERTLQIVGIACLALATRIEENQPYNGVRQKNILVGSNLYSRCEVVAMEWLVQEVLNFQCFVPTIYNFLWFYLKAARADEEVEKKAKYLAKLLQPERLQMYYMPSTVAAAVVILASLEGKTDSAIQRVIETHVRTKFSDLHECIESLEWLLKYV